MKQLLFSLLLMVCLPVMAEEPLEAFINKMVTEHGFDKAELDTLFEQVEFKQSIVKAMSRPAEKAKPWHEYRNIFLTGSRIGGGVKFWQENEAALAKAEAEYGVPAEIILAILGVETKYGRILGSYRVIDALTTLAFNYPKGDDEARYLRRSQFFLGELEAFLILTREEGKAPLEPVGSYAGAMGLGQFMPSSYRAYAVDFDEDAKRDIWTNPTDAIGSIANYLKRHGWVPGQSIVHRTKAISALPEVKFNALKPSFTRQELAVAGFSLDELPKGNDYLSLISLTQKDGEEYWLGRQNFYAITRYNHSRMYAMAVYQLAEAIRSKKEQQ